MSPAPGKLVFLNLTFAHVVPAQKLLMIPHDL